jgi:exosome complex component RRP40
LDILSFPTIYEPQKNDLVICTIKMKSADYYTVDMAAPLDGVLGSLEFDGATKRNKPNINQGALVYCRVLEYSKYTGAKLSCFNKGFNTNN